MKKTTIALCAVAVLFACSLILCSGCGRGKKGIIEYIAHNTSSQNVDAPKAIDIYIDASGSMKGYVDGVTGTFKTNIPDLTVNPTNKASFSMPEDSVRCFTINNKKIISHDTRAFCNNIRDKSIFNGASTELHNMFDVVANNVISNCNHVAIIVSDCILSFPHSDIVRNSETNIQNIGVLESNVTRSMTRLVNANLSVAIVQYKSDFNGNYYYSYRDTPLASAKGNILSDRPYYLIIIGKKSKIDAIFNKNVLPDGYSGVYMYNTESAQPVAHVIRAQKSGAVSKVIDNIPSIRVQQKGPAAYFYVGVEDFPIASYLEPLDMIMKSPNSKQNIISSVEQVNYNDVNNDKNIGKDKVTASYFYKVTLKSGEELKNISDATDELIFTHKTLDAKTSEITDDNVEDASLLAGKTFMFSHLTAAIEKAYLGAESDVAKVAISIEKEQ